uniref:UDP-glucose pyrophosphorylase 2 n=1 Tax=Equus asinus TaxID=9793 RepID=A0A9L0K6Q4_EQUAS
MSQDGASQFQEVIRQELEFSVKKELEKILTTAPSHEFEHTKKDLDGFRKLFHRFLQEKGPSVDWGKIQRPPEDSIFFRAANSWFSSIICLLVSSKKNYYL